MTKDIKNIIREKRACWFKCRNSMFDNTVDNDRYKLLTKQVKNRIKHAIKKFETN